MAVFREVLAEGGVMGLYKGIGASASFFFFFFVVCLASFNTTISSLCRQIFEIP